MKKKLAKYCKKIKYKKGINFFIFLGTSFALSTFASMKKERAKFTYNIEYSEDKYQFIVDLFEKNSTIKMILQNEVSICNNIIIKI